MSFVHTIKFRVTVWYLAVLGVLLALLSTGVYLGLSSNLHRNFDHSLELRAARLQTAPRPTIFANIMDGSFQEELGEIIVLFLYNGNELIDISARNVEIPQDEHLVYQALAGQSSFSTVETAGSGRMRLYGVPFHPDSPVTFRDRPGTLSI